MWFIELDWSFVPCVCQFRCTVRTAPCWCTEIYGHVNHVRISGFRIRPRGSIHPRLLESRSLKAEREGLYYFLFVHPNGSSEWGLSLEKRFISQTPIKKSIENNRVLKFDTSGLIRRYRCVDVSEELLIPSIVCWSREQVLTKRRYICMSTRLDSVKSWNSFFIPPLWECRMPFKTYQ